MGSFDIYQYLQNNYSIECRKYVSVQSYETGTYIYIPVDDPHHIFEILEGGVKLGSYSPEGDEVTYDVVGRPDIFGNFHYLNNKFFEFAKALTPIALRIYELSFFKNLIVHDPLMSEWFNKYVVDRWCRAETRLFHISSGNVNSRISQLEKQLKAIDESNIFQRLTQKDIADLIGASRQSVAQNLKKRR